MYCNYDAWLNPNSELGNEIIWEFMDACKLVAGFLPLQNDFKQLNPLLTAPNNKVAADAIEIMSNYIADKERSVRVITRVVEYQTFTFVYALDFVKWAQSSGYSIPKDLSNLLDELITTLKKTDQADVNKSPVKTNGSAGRPKTKEKNAQILKKLIESMTVGIEFTPTALPGNAKNLLDACKRIERAKTSKTSTFQTTPSTFKRWLKLTGYTFKTGRTLAKETNYWTKLCVETMVKIPDDIFI